MDDGGLGREVYVLQRWGGTKTQVFSSEVKQAPIRYKYGYFTPRFQPIYDVDTLPPLSPSFSWIWFCRRHLR